jgi:hypothetical protein
MVVKRINRQFSGWFFDLFIFLEPQFNSKIGSLSIFWEPMSEWACTQVDNRWVYFTPSKNRPNNTGLLETVTGLGWVGAFMRDDNRASLFTSITHLIGWIICCFHRPLRPGSWRPRSSINLGKPVLGGYLIYLITITSGYMKIRLKTPPVPGILKTELCVVFAVVSFFFFSFSLDPSYFQTS